MKIAHHVVRRTVCKEENPRKRPELKPCLTCGGSGEVFTADARHEYCELDPCPKCDGTGVE